MTDQTTSREDLDEIRASVRGFLARYGDMKAVRRAMDTAEGFDESLWSSAAEQLGLQALVIPDAFGGAGLSLVEQGLAMEELGRSLAVGPFLSSSVLVTHTVLQSSDASVKEDLLPALAAGEIHAAAALAERTWEQGVERPGVMAYALGDGWRLTGAKHQVLDGHTADVLLVSAATPNGTSLFLVDGDAAGVSRRAVPVVDLTRKLAVVEFDSTPARLVGLEGDAGPVLRRGIDLSVAALAAEQVGVAEKALEITVEYLKIRSQFGRPLASFQALKHRAADMLVDIETARAVTGAALLAGAEERWNDLGRLAALAKARSWDVLDHVSAEAVQLHGGVGFTWEFDPHLYFKRARGNQFLFGDLTTYRERAAASIGL
jgi:alkylation response protein AidB-like acyl-CoA dehydrogenase